MSEIERPRFWSLCREEPFRVFFPVGLLVGISGVSLWPLYFTGIHKFYPGVMHGRMMIQGFLMAFIMGFLGTAAPRLTGTRPFSGGALGTFLALLAAVVGLQIGHRPQIADCLFLFLLGGFGGCLFRRFRQRTELPPPSFGLVGCGFLHALLGTALLIFAASRPEAMRAGLLGNALLYQGFVLCLLLGVGGFLLPRFLGLAVAEEEEAAEALAWRRRMSLSLGVGALLLLSFFLEVWTGRGQVFGFARGVLSTVYLLAQVPLYRKDVQRATLAQALRLGFVLLLIGLFLPGLLPMQRVGALHLVFIGGFTLITFSVATRVVLGHSGQGSRVQQRLPFLTVTVALLLIGAVLRIWGDFLPASRSTMLNTASYLWMLAAGIWGWRLLPAVRIPDSES